MMHVFPSKSGIVDLDSQSDVAEDGNERLRPTSSVDELMIHVVAFGDGWTGNCGHMR